ncbi:MAG: hypothetical protein Q9219_001222 [cf. Caloplaca sp. 3 TL-2023]
MARYPHGLRRHALEKIAVLSAGSQEPSQIDPESGLSRLSYFCTRSIHETEDGSRKNTLRMAEAPMGISELEALLALSRAVPLVEDATTAKKLLEQLTPYLSEVHTQAINPSPFLHSIEPSPWESLTSTLAAGILSIGVKFTSLHDQVSRALDEYLQNCLHIVNSTPATDTDDTTRDYVQSFGVDRASTIASLSTSLLGFLEAVSGYCHFYTVPQRTRLLNLLRQILNDDFMVSVEGVFSSIRTTDAPLKGLHAWRSHARRYAASGRPQGAMLLQQSLMKVVLSCSTLLISGRDQLHNTDTFNILLFQGTQYSYDQGSQDTFLIELITELASQMILLLEDGADYLQLGSAWQQRIAFATKAHTLTAYLHCVIADEEIAESESLISWLEDVAVDPIQMADDGLASVILQSMAVLSRSSPTVATNFSRLLPRFIVQGSAKGETIDVAARSLAYVLQLLSQDAVITGLYSLGNVLSNSNTDRTNAASGPSNGTLIAPHPNGRHQQHATGSSISVDLSGEEETTAAYGNVVRAIVGVANSCENDKITALALSILLQKLGRLNKAVDIHIIKEGARLVASGGPVELKSLLKLYARICHDAAVQRNENLLAAVREARLYLASELRHSPLSSIMLTNLLENIISKGDVHESEHTHQADVELASREIAELLEPLASLVNGRDVVPDNEGDQNIIRLHREAWYNMVIHSITPNSVIGQQHADAFQTLAVQSRPLIAEDRADQFESEIELNTVLRRGMNAPNTAEQKLRLISLLPRCESDIRALSYPRVIFLHSTYLVETLRAGGGDCTHMLTYFLDPSLNGSAMENCMAAIADEVFKIFLSGALSGRHGDASAPMVAAQLAQMLTNCCHRIPRVQQIASSCADRVISSIPSSLCQRSSLFGLLELLDIMWMSCLDLETDEYNWKSHYTSERGEIQLELSDNFELRESTLNALHKRARLWVTSVISIAPLDVKDGNLSRDWSGQSKRFDDDSTELEHLARRTRSKQFIPMGEMRDTLRRAAALLCRTHSDRGALIHHLVGIPFATFTKQSIKLGVSLWLGVINENPQMESRILIEIAEQWEGTVHGRVGAFSSKLQQVSGLWSFGGNRLQIKAESRLIADVENALKTVAGIGTKNSDSLPALSRKQDLLQVLLENEQMRLVVWLYPLDHERRHVFSMGHAGKPSETLLLTFLETAWAETPGIAVQLATRFQSLRLTNGVRQLLLMYPERVLTEPDALQILLGPSLPNDVNNQLKYLLYWAPVNPITAATYFLPYYGNHPFILQYAMRALESHSVDVTFFYVPQIVQALRYDVLGYVQRYIIETAKVSQLFAHQILWNMKANAYKDENSSIEDSLKPTLDAVMQNMISSFSGTDKAFYEREFSFFNEITDISGKLRPFIKKTKPEKKQKIEEELRKIKVEIGVYLPSNPEGTVIGIDRKSGKPLQSHAKAPYMATFRISKNKGDMAGTDDMLEKVNEKVSSGRDEQVRDGTYEVWQSAIFKVGDDCRQDVLALQMIAAFRGIFNSVGLDVYVYPYRVTATAPGCGVVDVLPNSISRDMLGREAVNGLYDYFVSKYGTETSIRFQEARSNFVKSMAAYSVISYLLQFKDRHNGNIMVDDAGHILHIDFGFCFDIAPGGVRFERAPFKLTSEMVAVMGGSTTSQSYRWFEELCIKAFLVSRQHTEKLCHIVVMMLGSGLPCFKPETITHLRERFVLEKTDREAASFMRDLIKKSYGSYSTKGYDQFQLLTNGIPY